MDNQLQPIDLIAQELSEKTMQLAHYKVCLLYTSDAADE